MSLSDLVVSKYEDMLNNFKSWRQRGMIIEDGEMGETRPMFTSIFSFSP